MTDQVLYLVAALAATAIGLALYWAYLQGRLATLRRAVDQVRRDRRWRPEG